MQQRKELDRLPPDPKRKEISPLRGLISYVALSGALHLVVLGAFGPPSGQQDGTMVLATALRVELPSQGATASTMPNVAPATPVEAVPFLKTASAPQAEVPPPPGKAAFPGSEALIPVDIDESARPISLGRLIYPVEQLLNGIEGTVVVDVLIDSVGNVESVSIVRSAPPEVFDRAAVAAIAETTFRPARRGGLPIRSIKRIEVSFDPRDEAGER